MSTYEISKSSLLSLKAEILRKQEVISKAKIENEAKIKVLKKVPLEIKNKGVEERSQNDYEEDLDLLKLSKTVLEHKTEIYEKLSSGILSEEERKKYEQVLVRFNVKNSNQISDLPPSDSESNKRRSESEDDYYESDENETKDPKERWVEYVDCFGRTKKCMQKDLEFLKSKDEEMKEKKQLNQQEIHNDDNSSKDVAEDREISRDCDQTELTSHDMRRELQRRQWEKEEEQIRNKSNIHYEDVLFGEARTHGVGYYGFSKDEEERAKQQEALRNLRKETEDKQKKAQQLKETREKLLAARLKAARNRKRARMGLPPEEDEPEPINLQPEKSEEELQNHKEQEEKECLLEEARKKYVRPWDVGKEGVKDVEVMTQKEWVEKKREDRPTEFAPPTNYRKNFRATELTPTEDNTEVNETLKFSSKPNSTHRQNGKIKNSHWKQKNVVLKHTVASFSEMEKLDQKVQMTNTRKDIYFNENIPENKNCDILPRNFTERTNNSTDLNSDFDDSILKNYKKSMNALHKIIDIDDNECSNSLDNVHKRKGVEVAPPPTYDYYGPTSSKSKRNRKTGTDIHDSIEAGLKFLRKQVEDKQKSSNVDDMFLF